MGTDYFSRHHEGHRAMMALVIKEMSPRTVLAGDYAAGLTYISRSDIQEERGWREPPRTFATCLDCFGDGVVPNEHWIDGETPSDPEAIDCDTCGGCGLVEIVDPPAPAVAAALDDDLPF